MPDNFIRLLQSLKAKTALGNVDWEEAGEAMFRAVLESGMVRIGEERGSDYVAEADDYVPRKYYLAWLLTPDARVVREQVFELDGPGYETVRDLFDAARQHALGSDDLIGRMLVELDASHISTSARAEPPEAGAPRH